MLFDTLLLSTLATSVTLCSAIGLDHGSHRAHSRRHSTPTIDKRTTGAPVVPADWPTTTQAGPIPSATAASAADPFLLSISDALNNNGNSMWTTKYTGDLTFYGTGITACGDTYTDSTYTAAVSMLMYDTWPGATLSNTNRNPVCGPWTTGRSALNAAGQFFTAVPSSEGIVTIGGDNLPNCTAGSQCHIPMTATVTNPATGLSVVVQIVDRCKACAFNDIDLTPTAFAAIADINSGRVHGVEWSFNVM